MSIPTDALEHLIYLGDMTEECPYLPDRVSTLRFGNGMLVGEQYRELLDKGYRRNGLYVYRPVCRICKQCKVLRVPVDDFVMSREQRRVWRRGQGVFSVTLGAPAYSAEKAEIYDAYLRYQHGEAQPKVDAERYNRFLVHTCLGKGTIELQLWAEGRLAGIGVVDRVGDALSTVYFYFHPDFARLSPGTYSALYEIELAKQWGLRYYYLGYYIEPCASMNYKIRFRPCEVKDPDAAVWRVVEAE